MALSIPQINKMNQINVNIINIYTEHCSHIASLITQLQNADDSNAAANEIVRYLEEDITSYQGQIATTALYPNQFGTICAPSENVDSIKYKIFDYLKQYITFKTDTTNALIPSDKCVDMKTSIDNLSPQLLALLAFKIIGNNINNVCSNIREFINSNSNSLGGSKRRRSRKSKRSKKSKKSKTRRTHRRK